MNPIVKLWNWAWGKVSQYFRYCIVGSIGTLISLGLIYLFTEYVIGNQLIFIGFLSIEGYLISAIIATVIASLWNFMGNKHYTFSLDRRNSKHPLSLTEKIFKKILNGVQIK